MNGELPLVKMFRSVCTSKKLLVLFIFIIFVFPPTAVFAAQSQEQQHADSIRSQSTSVGGSGSAVPTLPPVVNDPVVGATRVGRLSEGSVNILVSFKMRNREKLQYFIDSINRQARGERQVLTEEQFEADYAPTQTAYDEVISFLTRNDISIIHTWNNRLLLVGRGVVTDVERVFNVEIDLFQYRNMTFYKNSKEVKIPTLIELDVAGIEISSFPVEPYAIANDRSPVDLRNAYGTYNAIVYNGWTGVGETIGIVDAYGDPTITADVNSFNTYYNLPSFTLTVGGTGGAAPPGSSWPLETALDVEWAHAMAPGATIGLQLTPDAATGTMFGAVNTLVSLPNPPNVISLSWGRQESWWDSVLYSSIFSAAASRGIKVYVSTGDQGAYNGGTSLSVNYPASDPNVIAVGGTTPYYNTVQGTDEYYEYGWSGSGGGYSTVFSEPTYQSSAGIPNPTGKRALPDVSLEADPGVKVYLGGSLYTGVGGTSLSAPLMAGIAAVALNGNWHLDNTALYNLYTPTSKYNVAFHDVYLSGNNGFYNVGSGWDAVTGLGSINFHNFADIYSQSGAVTLTGQSLSPSSIAPGQSFTLSYAISNPNPTYSLIQIGLGASIRLHSSTIEIVDISNDIYVSLLGGTSTQSRTFATTLSFTPGWYDVHWQVWMGPPGYGNPLSSSGWQLNQLQLTGNPSTISVSVNPSSIYFGSGTAVSGTITSPVPGDKSGTVYVQYSTDGSSWINAGSTTSDSTGYYSFWWVPPSAGTFYVRSYWNGNSLYGGSTSNSVTLTVTSSGGNLADHTMCKGVQPNDPWDPITRTNTFYTDDPAAYSWLKFVDIYDGPHYVHWDWYDPDGQHWATDGTIPAPPPDQYWVWYKVWAWLYPLHFADSKLGRPFTTKVYYDSNLVVTETWTVIKHQSTITVSLSSNSITYGQSVTIGSQLSPSFSDGTTTLQYSTDGVNWNNLASGTPSNGYYSYTWTPPNTGTYYFRAIWSGNLDYYGSTSSTQTLIVNRASTSLTTSLSSSTITYGSSVAITASISPILQGKSLTIQYSIDGSTWFYLSSGTTNSAGQYSYSWTPDAGLYYLRSTWDGDANYYGATSLSQQLTVNKAPTSTSCSLSTHSINYGESVTITGTVSVSVNDGTITLENSTDGANWNLISSGIPSSGSYQYTWTPTGGGTFYIRAAWSGNHNYLGSTSSSQTLNVLVDNTPPVVIISCPANGDYIGPVPMIWVNGTVTEDNKGTHVPLINDTRFILAQWESATGKFAFKNGTTIPDASIPVRINFTDIAGNTGSSTVRFTVDTTKPAVDITYPADGAYLNAGTVWVNGTITELNKGGSAPAINDSSFTLSAWNGVDFAFRNQTAIADGTISVSVSFTDLAGNTGSRTVTFTLDTVYPVINITYPLEGHYFDSEAVIWINGTFAERNLNLTKPLIINDTSFMLANWAWNLTTYEGTFAFKNTTALLDGAYHVKVGITDLAGNSGSATVTFTVDTMPPIVVITHPTNGQYLDPLAIWVNGTVTDLNKGTLQPQINSTEFSLITWDPITGAFAFKNNTAIPDGSIFIKASFTDLAGKTGNATVYFMLDTTAPVVTITYPTEGTYLDGIEVIWINGTFIEKNFDIAGLAINGTFAYVTHTWNPITCEGTFAFKNTSVLADGTYQMMVSLTDKAGKTGFETVTFSVDTVPPIVDITYPTNGQYLNTTTIWVNGTIAELNKGTHQPQINNPAFSLLSWDAATGAFAFRSDAAIPEGTISVAVNFTDLAGKTGTATVYFILDTTLPIVNITYPTGGAYLNAPILWINGTITELNKGTFQPSINDSRLSLTFWNSTTGVFAFENSTAISDGLISLRVSFADLAGNTGFGTVFFTLDTTAPIIAITTPLNSLYVKGSVWINATIVEINPFSYIIAINGTSVSSGSGQVSWQWLTTIYADGAYVVNVTATDAAGNNGSDAVTVTADNTPPVETIVSPLLGSYLNYSTVWINETLTDATSSINLTTIITSLNGVPVSYDYDIATGLLSYHAVGLADGNYTVAVTVEDLAGNMATNSWWFVVDVTPPVKNVVSPTPGSYLNVSTVWINETLTDDTSGINASTIAMTLNASLVPCNFDPATGLLSYQAVFLADGLYTVNVNVRDIAGNLAANSWNFTIDVTKPLVNVMYPTEGANVTITPNVWINGTVTELNMGVLTPSINDSRFNLAYWDYATGKFAFSNNTVISEGPICVMVSFTDLAGNTGLDAVTFNVTAPTIKLDTKIVFTLSPNPAYVGQMVTLLGNLTESDTGMPISNAQVDLYVDGTFKGNFWTNASGWFQGSGYVSSGIYQISVPYPGNATFNPSSRTETLIVYVATIKVWTDKTVYHVGETMKVYVRVRNGGSALPVRAIITVKLPNGNLYTELNMTTTLPANYDSGDVLWNTFTIPAASLGNYTWIAELRNPTTGALISQSTWNWSLAATAMETPSVGAVLQANPIGRRRISVFFDAHLRGNRQEKKR